MKLSCCLQEVLSMKSKSRLINEEGLKIDKKLRNNYLLNYM
jgi:hypothetical protein